MTSSTTLVNVNGMRVKKYVEAIESGEPFSVRNTRFGLAVKDEHGTLDYDPIAIKAFAEALFRLASV